MPTTTDRLGRRGLAFVAVALVALVPGGCSGNSYVVGELKLGMDLADIKRVCKTHGWGLQKQAELDNLTPYRIFEKKGDPDSTILYRISLYEDNLVGIKALRPDGDDTIIDAWSTKLGDPSEDDTGQFYMWEVEEQATYFSRKDGKVVWVVYKEFEDRF